MLSMIRSLVLVSLVAAPAAAATPTSRELIDRAITAAGGAETLAGLGVLELTIDEQENQLDGNIRTRKMTAFVDATNLDNLRLELPGDLVLVRNAGTGWASMQGEVDARPQSPKMARGTVNQKLFPLLLPFSLQSDGLVITDVVASSFEGTESWRATMQVVGDFFTSPTMNTAWHLEFAKDDGRLLIAEFQPPVEFREARPEGVRYRTLRAKTVEGIKLPTEVLLDGINPAGIETGHTRIVRVKPAVRGPWEPALFIHPDRLEAFEDSDIPGLP